jgi:type I restriction enzyme S subunit
VAGLICNSDVLYYRFLFFCLLHIRNEIILKAWGGAQPNLSQTIIKNFEIPLPPLSEQKKIVSELDVLSEKVQKIEELQKQTAQDFKALRQSILHQAFEGKL